VSDQHDRIAAVRSAYADRATSIDDMDGLTVVFADGSWFNVRPSNTEPLLRLNVEAATEQDMIRLRDDVLVVIRG
jgi:phosphomannomutase